LSTSSVRRGAGRRQWQTVDLGSFAWPRRGLPRPGQMEAVFTAAMAYGSMLCSASSAGFSSLGSSQRYFCFSDYGLVAGCTLGLVAASAPPPLASMARVQSIDGTQARERCASSMGYYRIWGGAFTPPLAMRICCAAHPALKVVRDWARPICMPRILPLPVSLFIFPFDCFHIATLGKCQAGSHGV
jgi:hypothetical protein